jgi:phosphopantetheinyl transferase
MTVVFWNFFAGNLNGAEGILSPVEQARLAEMRFERRRRSFLMGRETAKQLLQQHPACAGLPADAITIENRPAGAPFALVQGREITGSLSISHRADAAAAALSLIPGTAIGVDLEVVEEHSAAFLEDFFTAEEAAFAHSLQKSQQAAWVASAWSAKEALLKALQVGLRVDSRSVTIFPDGDPSPQAGWQSLRGGGPALSELSSRVWLRFWEGYVLTLALITKSKNRFEENQIELRQIHTVETAMDRLKPDLR